MSDADLDELRVWASAHVPVGSRQARQVLGLLDELAGVRKANALLLAGMMSACEGRDELKHDLRRLTAERDAARADVARLEGMVQGLADRVAAQSELPGARADAPRGGCGVKFHADDCRCGGDGGDR